MGGASASMGQANLLAFVLMGTVMLSGKAKRRKHHNFFFFYKHDSKSR